MGINYLWDTNTVIYYFKNAFPLSGEKFIDKIALGYKPTISIVTEIELLCWKSASENDIAILNKFISEAIIYELDQDVKIKTIEIRKEFNLKLPDAIIAASAIIKDHILISRNVADFKKISQLKLIDPFNIEEK